MEILPRQQIKTGDEIISEQLEIIKQLSEKIPQSQYEDIFKFFNMGVEIGRMAEQRDFLLREVK